MIPEPTWHALRLCLTQKREDSYESVRVEEGEWRFRSRVPLYGGTVILVRGRRECIKMESIGFRHSYISSQQSAYIKLRSPGAYSSMRRTARGPMKGLIVSRGGEASTHRRCMKLKENMVCSTVRVSHHSKQWLSTQETV